MYYNLFYNGSIHDKELGIEIVPDRESEKYIDELYYSSGVGGFLCDVLNQDYFALSGGNEYDIERMHFGAKVGLYNELDFRRELRDAIIVELSQLDFQLVKKFTKYIFCNTEHESLNNAERFFACNIATNGNNPFSKHMQTDIYNSVSLDCNSPGYSIESNMYKKLECIPKDFSEAFERACSVLEDNPKAANMHYLMTFDSIADVFVYLFLEMVKQDGIIKQCPNCGRFFSPSGRVDTIYCSNPSPQDPNKTCQQYAKYSNYLLKTQTDLATKLYKQIYNAKANRVKRNPDNEQLSKDLNAFLSEAKRLKKSVKSGDIEESHYISWLQGIKDNS